MAHSEMDMTVRDYDIKFHKNLVQTFRDINEKVIKLMEGDYLVLSKTELGLISSCLSFRISSECEYLDSLEEDSKS